MTEEGKKLFRNAKRITIAITANQKVIDKSHVMRARWVMTCRTVDKAKARLCVLEFQGPYLTEVPRDSPLLWTQTEALILQSAPSHTVQFVCSDIRRRLATIVRSWRFKISIWTDRKYNSKIQFNSGCKKTEVPTLLCWKHFCDAKLQK